MTHEEIVEKVNEFLVDDLEIDGDKIRPEAMLKEEVGIDSLDLVDIIVIVNRIFGFKIEKTELKDLKTLNKSCLKRRSGLEPHMVIVGCIYGS